MTIRIKQAIGLALFAASAVVTTAFAHTTILKKNTPDAFAARTDLAGTSSVLNHTSISHGCGDQPVKAMTMLFPNGAEPVVVDQDDNEITLEDFFGHFEEKNNIVMGAKPTPNVIWKQIEVRTGPVPLYNNHGDKTTDTRAFAYKKGMLPTHLFGTTAWQHSYGKIKSDKICLEKMRMQIPIVNYCKKSETDENRVDAWIGRLTDKFNDPAVVSVGFWPYVDVANPHYDPDECGEGNSYYYQVSPNDDAIDEFLLMEFYWPANVN